MDQMSAMDAAFLYAESANTPMHIGAVAAFGLTGDYDTVPDLALLARGIEPGIEELLALATAAATEEATAATTAAPPATEPTRTTTDRTTEGVR